MCATPIEEREGRRPFLQVVVLFANDPRVYKYAKDVQSQFLDNGVDVFLQSGIKEADIEIKTENLAEIITSSTADFLTVIGDRNMKNKSCQAKKRGKLMEMDVEDVIAAIWEEWDPYQNTTPEDWEFLEQERMFSIIEKHTGIKKLAEKMTKMEEALNELKQSKKVIAKKTVSLLEDATHILTQREHSMVLKTSLLPNSIHAKKPWFGKYHYLAKTHAEAITDAW